MKKTITNSREKEYFYTAVALFFAFIIGTFLCLGTYQITGNLVLEMEDTTSSVFLGGSIVVTAVYFVWMAFRIRKIYRTGLQ